MSDLVDRVERARSLMNEAMKMCNESIVEFSQGRDSKDVVDTVWESYRRVEHAIILIRLSIGDEYAPDRESLEDSSDIGGLLVKASDALSEAIGRLDSDLNEVLRKARVSRDALRSVLSRFKMR
ncbi:MAG: hypothetical protein HXX80_01205 [Nitrososphaerales archaeon]|nr:hypothetical protein [Nitrososphaerales archaeon]